MFHVYGEDHTCKLCKRTYFGDGQNFPMLHYVDHRIKNWKSLRGPRLHNLCVECMATTSKEK